MFMILGRRGVKGLVGGRGERKGGLMVEDWIFDGIDG